MPVKPRDLIEAEVGPGLGVPGGRGIDGRVGQIGAGRTVQRLFQIDDDGAALFVDQEVAGVGIGQDQGDRLFRARDLALIGTRPGQLVLDLRPRLGAEPGVVEEEFLRELQGSKGALVYREMQNNDPILGGFLYAVHMLIRQITWTAKPSDPDIQASIEAAELLNSSMHGMQYSWKNTIDENLSMIPYGWAAHEVVYKKREDGQIGWKHLPLRSQDTLYEWVIEPDGTITAMKQENPNTFEIIEIPNTKLKKKITTDLQKEIEGKDVLKLVSTADFLILMDEKGKEYNSVDFSNFIQKRINAGVTIVFVIGGSFGFSEMLYSRADFKIALSQMTFSHQMVRLFFIEQIYRAFTILKGEKYHHY